MSSTHELKEYYIAQRNQGENYQMIHDFSAVLESDYDINKLINMLFTDCIERDVVTYNKEWFSILNKMPTFLRKDMLCDWFKSSLVDYLYRYGVNDIYLQSILNPKELSNLNQYLKDGNNSLDVMRVISKLISIYKVDIYKWWLDNFKEDDIMIDDNNLLTYTILDDVLFVYLDDVEVLNKPLSLIYNQSDKDLFDELCDLLIEDSIDLLSLLDLVLLIKSEVTNRDDIAQLVEDVPQVENPQQFDILGDIANKNNISAEHTFDYWEEPESRKYKQSLGMYGDITNEDEDKDIPTGTSELDSKLIMEVEEVQTDLEDINEVSVEKIRNSDVIVTTLPIGDCAISIQDMSTFEVLNTNISELVFYLTVDLPENKCIVNILNLDGSNMPELTLEMIDYALTTQLTPEGDYIGDDLIEIQDTQEEVSLDNIEPNFTPSNNTDIESGSENEETIDIETEDEVGVNDNSINFGESFTRLAEDENDLSIRNKNLSNQLGFDSQLNLATANSFYNDNAENLEVDTLGLEDIVNNTTIETIDPEVAFGLNIIQNDDDSISVEGNIPVIINALCGIEAEAVKANLLGDIDDEFNNDNNPTMVSL